MVGEEEYGRQDYFEWLCDRVGANRGRRSYLLLCGDLHDMIFVGHVPRDENREYDGKDLREQYFWETQRVDESFEECPCTMLEMLIALADRMDFAMGSPDDDRCRTEEFFWELIDNMGLTRYCDDDYVILNGRRNVEKAVLTVIQRKYNFDGSGGGLFPLVYPENDQRDVEIWYQMQSYLRENYE